MHFSGPQPVDDAVDAPGEVAAVGGERQADLAITEQALTGTAAFVDAPWRYERINGIGHWPQLDAPDHVNTLLLNFLTTLPTYV